MIVSFLQGILKLNTICIYKSGLIVCVEEVLFAKRHDLFIEPVQKTLISLGHCGRDGVRAAQRINSYRISLVLSCKCNDLSVVIGPCYAGSILKRALGCRVGIEFLQLDLRIVLGQIGLRRRSGDDDDLIVLADLRQVRDHSVVVGDDAQRHIHVRQREVDLFRSLRGHRKVSQDDIDLSGLQIFDSAGCLRGNVLNFHAQILSDPVGKIYIISLILTILINISEGTLVREDADIDLAVRLNLLQRSVTCIRTFFRGFSLLFDCLRLRLIRALLGRRGS